MKISVYKGWAAKSGASDGANGHPTRPQGLRIGKHSRDIKEAHLNDSRSHS